MNRITLAMLASVSIAMPLATAGCASSGGVQTTERTVTRMNDLIGALESGRDQVSETIASLDALTEDPSGDLRPRYRTFANEVDALSAAADRAASRRSDFESQRDAYVASWEAQMASIGSESLQQRAQMRRDRARELFEQTSESMDAARAAYEPVIGALEDIRTYLEYDLNTRGVRSITDLAASAKRDAITLNTQLDSTLMALNRLAEAMSATSPADGGDG